MTVRERILANKLVQKIEDNKAYAGKIGLGYTVKTNRTQKKEKEK